MTYKPGIGRKLKVVLRKVYKKDRKQWNGIKGKMDEIVENPHHYKPLSNKLKNRRRVQIGSYVLVFKIYEQEKVVKFIDYDHHDNIYKKG
ncbi:hypothetical protein BEH94_09900 [Candidatus Altiarchaeales archaeon WOR_SM1_SCG]|nr:hypothetical protein BEH94_09900 [Candidatus Altiarchaeales archaeon WOR_SM1_SCG]ODS35183.1 MAG: hypothetical protein A7315_14900 [Candidatus Altiarchaeales archaeon WOR_SM1_79]